MPSKHRRIFIAVGLLVILALACNIPNKATVDAQQATSVAQTLTAVASNYTPTPSFTPFSTLTPSLTPTSTILPTATPPYPYVTLSQSTNCRTGPAKEYDLVDTFYPGQTIEVIAMDPLGDYWYVRSPNSATVFCWLWDYYATGGNLFNVAVFTPPPPPTPTPAFDVSFSSMETCVGWMGRFKLVNIGPTTFKSLNYSLTNTDTGEVVSDTKNTFDDVTGCLSSSTIDNLDPGGTTWITTLAFINDPAGHRISLRIKLCANESLGGACTERTINFKP